MKQSRKIIFSTIFLIIFGVFLFAYYREGTLPVNSQEPKTKIFVIQKGDSLSTIAKNLSNEGFIRNKIVFYIVVKKMGIDKNIQAGDFRLTTSMNLYQIANTLTHGTLDTWVTIIEGLRKEEIGQIIAQNMNIPETEFIKYAKEGYLFPDTYLFPKDATIPNIISILTNNFNSKFDSTLQEKVHQQRLTIDQALTLASIVEKEARLEEDRPKVASILLKRLKMDWALQSDATIQYVLGYQPNEKTWWKKDLTADDLKTDSPYNTYTNKGLPPGPICNPGLASIQAVSNADENTPYWFYLSDKNGKIHYSTTIEEHNANIKKYLQ